MRKQSKPRVTNMDYNEAKSALSARKVKPTANRILIYRALAEATRPVSLTDLETALETIDKASIFRTLTMFADHELVHTFEDGSKSMKYELRVAGVYTLGDMHAHFYCEKCLQTFCLEGVRVPQVKLPEGFTARDINYIVKGVCPDCQEKL